MQWLYAPARRNHAPNREADGRRHGGARKIPDPRLELVFGRDLCRLSSRPRVTTCSRPAGRTSRIDAFLPYKWQKRPGKVRFQRIDLNHDLDALKALLAAERPTHVVNFAAQSMVGESWLNPDHWMMTNVVSTVRLHELLRNYDGLERYVHVTTPEVYGSTEGWVTEDAPFNPSTPYAVSRAAGDMSLRTYFANYQFPVVFTRAANVYGPGQQLYRIVPRTIVAAMGGQKLRLDGGGKSVRVFIHMTDVSDATLKIAPQAARSARPITSPATSWSRSARWSR